LYLVLLKVWGLVLPLAKRYLFFANNGNRSEGV